MCVNAVQTTQLGKAIVAKLAPSEGILVNLSISTEEFIELLGDGFTWPNRFTGCNIQPLVTCDCEAEVAQDDNQGSCKRKAARTGLQAAVSLDQQPRQ